MTTLEEAELPPTETASGRITRHAGILSGQLRSLGTALFPPAASKSLWFFAIISLVLRHTQAVDDKGKYETDASVRDEANRRVAELLGRFPVYPELDVDFLRQVIGG